MYLCIIIYQNNGIRQRYYKISPYSRVGQLILGLRYSLRSLKNLEIISAFSDEMSVFSRMFAFEALAIASIDPMV